MMGSFELQAVSSRSTLINPLADNSVPIVANYSRQQAGGKLLAVASEEGYVSVLDVSSPASQPDHLLGDNNQRLPRARWEAHQNLIHDLIWAQVRVDSWGLLS